MTDLSGTATLRSLNFSSNVAAIRRKGNYDCLAEIFSGGFGRAYRTAFVRVGCERSVGVQLLAQGDIFSAEPNGRWILRDCFQRPNDHRIHAGQILLAGVGTLGETELFGRAIIADERLDGAYMSEDVFALEASLSAMDNALFGYAYLCSRIGVAAVRSCSYGTKTLKLRRDLLARLPVPRPSNEQRSRVAALIRRCVEQRETYLRELKAARKVIEDLPEMKEAAEHCSVRRGRVTTWGGPLTSLCAWNVASTGGALSLLCGSWRVRLSDVLSADGVFNGPRFARVECAAPHGVDFYSQRDVFLMRPVPRRIVRPAVQERLFFVPQDAVLAGSHGQLTDGGIFGKVELASFGAYRGGLTQDLLRLLFQPEHRSAAFAYLSTAVGARLLKSTAVGTSIPSMHLGLLRALPFPALSTLQRDIVHKHVASCEAARIESAAAEAEAIRIIEEEVLPSWLT